MRTLILIFTGFILALLFGPASHLHGIVSDHVSGCARARGELVNRARSQKTPGHFPGEMVDIFLQLEPRNSPGYTYRLPDSANTKMTWISYWPNENALLIETTAGYEKGSGGADIIVGVYDSTQNVWQQIFYDLGALDSVYDISHNGLYDFSYNYKWGEPMRQEFDGHEFKEAAAKQYLSDTDRIAVIIARQEGYGDFLDFEYTREEIFLDETSKPFIVAADASYGKYLIREDPHGEFQLLNYFENAVQIDILSKKHNAKSDIKVTNWNMTYSVYRWNGWCYVEYASGKWDCPA